ncbi:MAG: DUF1549 domain-containing protein, partial [Cyclobacteriaceae bacterium]
MPRPLLGIILLLIATSACRQQAASELAMDAPIPEQIDFNFHVKPILSDRCYACHGPDEKARKGDLRLDLEETAFLSLDSLEDRFAIVPGDLENSQLVHRISSNDPEFMMPPPESKLSLSDREIEILKRWIDQGAEWKPHWAFIPPKEAALPEVSEAEWAQNEIDHFILNKLEAEGLEPSLQARKEKLIRRLSFDFRGLPPSLEEIDAFIEDESPDAYEKVVDNFLSQKSYGERMALEWLDLARYADSHGYQDDLERSQWPWRDWVIKAFNQNMPYDQFVTWQLAGDLLPEPSYEQKLATGFNRNHKITQEVGVVDEEYRVEYVLDRVNTFSTSFMGLTVGCAQCHDHKFDPISQQEFYSLFSFFNSVPEEGRVEYGVEVAEPAIPVPDSMVAKYTSYIENLVQSQEQKIADYEKTNWEAAGDLDVQKESGSGKLPAGLVAYYPLDYIENGTVQEQLQVSRKGRAINGPAKMPGKFSGGLEFSGQNYLDLGTVKALDFRKPLSISFWLYSIENGARGILMSHNQKQSGKQPGYELGVYDDGIRFKLNRFVGDDERSINLQTHHILPGNEWAHITLTYDGSAKAEGMKIFMNGKEQELIIDGNNLGYAPTLSNAVLVGQKEAAPGWIRAERKGLIRTRLDELMIFNRSLRENEVQNLAKYNPLESLMAKENKSDDEKKRLFYHQLHHSDSEYQILTQWYSEFKFREMRMQTVVLNPTMVMADMDTLRPTFVLDRGQYSAPTKQQVYPATPEQVLPFPNDQPKNRLGLAQWLFDEQNPLTARVAVNR